jgi:hypothetical protein
MGPEEMKIAVAGLIFPALTSHPHKIAEHSFAIQTPCGT